MFPAAVFALYLLLQQAPQAPQAPQGQEAPPQLPINFTKVKLAVNTPPKLVLDDQNLFRFYSETVRRAPKFADMVGSFNLFNGPVPGAGMTHREFIQSTRPKDMYSSAGFTPRDVISWGLLTLVQRKGFELLKYGLKELAEAKTEAERKQIRLLIERELAALRGEIIK